MLSKELADSLRPVLLRLSLALAMVLILLVTGERSLVTHLVCLYIGLLIGAAWAALTLGVNAFRAEFRDHAWEYLFTAPRPAWRIWLDKIAARLLLLLLPAALILLLSWILGRIEPGLPRVMVAQSALADPRWVFPRLSFLMGLGFLVSLWDWRNWRPAVPFLLPVCLVAWEFASARLANRLGLGAGWRHPLATLPEAALLLLFLLRWRGLRRGTSLRRSLRVLVERRQDPLWRTTETRRSGPRGLALLEAARLWRGEALALLFLAGMVALERGTSRGGAIPVRTWVPLLLGPLALLRGFSHGYNLFAREFREQALEYLLTAPRPFLRVVADKVAARLLVQAPALLGFLVLALWQRAALAALLGPFGVLLDPRFFPGWYLLFFAAGTFMSPFAPRNMHALVSLATLYALVLPTIAASRLVALPVGAGPGSWPFFLRAAGGMVPAVTVLGLAFFSVAKRFHLATGERYAKVYGLRTLLPLTALAAASTLMLILG